MTRPLYLLLLALVLLAGCASSRRYARAAGSELGRHPAPYLDPALTVPQDTIRLRLHQGDSGVPAGQVVRGRLFGQSITPSKSHSNKLPNSPSVQSGSHFLGIFRKRNDIQNSPYLPSKKCKGCIFNLGNGDVSLAGKKAQTATGTGAALTVAGKKAQAAKADSGGFIGQAQARTQAAAGRGISQQATTEKKSLWATVLGYAGPVLLIGAAGLACYVWGWPLLLAAIRRRKSTDS